MENGTLNDYLRREVGLPREKKLTMVREVAAGLQYLHDKDIVHGDMTDTNILVSSDGRLYLADFALSMILAESDNTTFNSCHGGNSRWMPPEAISMPLEGMEQPEGKPTKAGDVYAYGCIMMRVFSGYQPYHRMKGAIAIMGAVLRGTEPFSQLTGIDEEIQQFAQQCLLRNSEHRPLIAHIVEFLWSQTNVTETIMKMMLSKLSVTLILKAVLRKCDYHANDLDVFCVTLKCKWVHESSETEVAVKTLRDDVNSQNDMDKICNRIRREMFVREGLRRDTILTLYGMTTGFGVLPSFVYPWMAGGSLHDYLRREYSSLSAHQKLNILLEVVDGIGYLHKKDIVHGNLTGDNVLIDGSGHIRITDFSHSVILAEASSLIFSEQLLGDARYIAPEFIVRAGRPGASKPTKAGDVYSYGCVAIFVLSGKVPYWWISEESQVLSEKRKGTEPFRLTLELGEVHLNLVRQCISAEISRPSIEKVLYLVLVRSFGAVDLTNAVRRLNKDYHNSGGFAYVHRCKIRPGDINASVRRVISRHQLPSMTTYVEVAVKEIILRNDADMLTVINRLYREIKLWLKLEHKNIVPLWGVADGFGSLPALVSPWLENGALTGYIHREHGMLSYNKKFALLDNVARGLQYLHSQSIVHGDLSGNNVLVDKNGTASLTDFGLSAFLPDKISQALFPTNPTCTVPYMAPEYLTSDGENNLSPKSDVYSFGGIMLEVLEGKVPYYYIRNQPAIINCISRGIRPKRPPASVVIECDWDFIQRCWLGDMGGRPSDEEILEFVERRAIIQS
ncbi:kinase-like domain-containing protein [Suillus lakei]|nr:kinase-like domain-containing protein [Suillus lakei]